MPAPGTSRSNKNASQNTTKDSMALESGIGRLTMRSRPVRDLEKAYGVGYKMITKCGWTPGEGLGAGRDGRKEPLLAIGADATVTYTINHEGLGYRSDTTSGLKVLPQHSQGHVKHQWGTEHDPRTEDLRTLRSRGTNLLMNTPSAAKGDVHGSPTDSPYSLFRSTDNRNPIEGVEELRCHPTDTMLQQLNSSSHTPLAYPKGATDIYVLEEEYAKYETA